MKRLLTLPALVFVLLPVRAETPASPPSVAGPSVGPIVRMRFTPGESSAYKLWLGLKGNMGAPGVEGGVPMTGSLSANAKLTSGKPAADGQWPVRFQISDLQYTMNGAPAMPADLPKAFEVGGTVSADGQFTPDAKSQERLAGGALMPGPAEFVEMMLRAIVSVPQRDLAKGDTWSLTAPVPFDASGGSRLTVTNTVQSVETAGGAAVASVRRTLSAPLNLTMSSPIALGIKGSVDGSGVVKVSGATGLPVDDTSTTRLRMTIAAPGDGRAKMEYTMDMEISTHVVAVPSLKPS